MDKDQSRRTRRRRWKGIDAFTAMNAVACALTFFPSIITIMGLNTVPTNDKRMVVAIVELCFSLLCGAFCLFKRFNTGSSGDWAAFVVALAILFAFIAYEGDTSLLWIASFPLVAVYGLGRRRGVLFSVALGAFIIATLYLTDGLSGAMADIKLTLLCFYAAIIWFSAYSCRREAGTSAAPPPGKTAVPASELSRLTSAELSEALDRARSESDDIVVLYRRESLETLNKIPDPKAVFSYILLENMVEPREDAGEENSTEANLPGGFEVRALGIDALLTRAESVIDEREAKKLIEFNKIQAQIDTALSRESDGSESTASYFDQKSLSYGLSEREAAVAQCILRGLTNKEISGELFISVETVKTHVKNLFKKCDVNNRIDFIKLFSRI